jgi:hypothetical protein
VHNILPLVVEDEGPEGKLREDSTKSTRPIWVVREEEISAEPETLSP